MKSVIEKVEAQENKIGEIEAAIKNIPDNTAGIADVKNAVKSIKEIAESISFPMRPKTPAGRLLLRPGAWLRAGSRQSPATHRVSASCLACARSCVHATAETESR